MDNLNENSSSSDSEEEDNGRHRNPRVIHRPINHFEELSNENFRKRYRVTKEGFLMILARIIRGLEGRRRNHITPVIQLLVALRFYATGSFLQVVADITQISVTTAWRIVHRVSPLIAALREEFIRFPATPEEIRQTQAEMFRISAFPRVLACMDGKHVPVNSYGGEIAEMYRSRHHTFSINVFGACNARLEFVALDTHWPGSHHDATVFRSTRLYQDFERGIYDDALLLGDSAYPDRPYLMTPLLRPVTAADQLYNEAQIRTRNCIERCFGVWSRRFGVVGKGGTRFWTPERTRAVIIASAVVHNIVLRLRPFRRRRINVDAYDRIHRDVQFGQGDSVRKRLITGYFQELI